MIHFCAGRTLQDTQTATSTTMRLEARDLKLETPRPHVKLRRPTPVVARICHSRSACTIPSVQTARGLGQRTKVRGLARHLASLSLSLSRHTWNTVKCVNRDRLIIPLLSSCSNCSLSLSPSLSDCLAQRGRPLSCRTAGWTSCWTSRAYSR